ncbi:acid protease, partial [Rhizopogon vinicolor AM-OR11-026]
PLTTEDATLWYASINVGTPAKTFTVDIDTGSSDIFLPSVVCGVSCDGHNKYDPSTSSTAVDLGKPFVLTYITGDVEGEQFVDNVAIGGYTAVGQTLGAAMVYSPTFSSTSFTPDGLAGFAFESISVYEASPLFQTLVQSGQLPEAVFGVKLSATGASELYVGGTNTALYQQDTLTYTPVTVSGFWQVTSDQVSRAGVQVGPSEVESIIDTGTSLILTDTATAASYYNGIPGAILQESDGFYSIPCDIIENYAPTFTFGGRPFTVSGETFNLGPIEDGSSDCLAGVAASSDIEDYWLVGDVFLQNVYSVFDMDQLRVGFAELA